MTRYHQPEKGVSNWHIPLNENFANLDTAVINEVETFADLPDPTGETSSHGVSRKYLVRGTGSIYRDTSGGWESIAGSRGGTGAYGIQLNGSNDAGSPRSGLAAEIRAALDSGRSYINVTGAWTMDGELAVSSGSYGPIGIIINARGTYIEYDGSDWMLTNDNTGDAGSALRGGSLHLYGGFWKATGDPDGFVRLIDTGGSHLYPKQTRDWRASSKSAVIYQLEEGSRWCESNHLGGRHHLLDVGIRSVASQGTSFQDNFVDNIHLSQIREHAFDLSGNWIDCSILNPTAIFSSEDSVFVRLNGNMGGCEIIAPELEDADNDLDNFYLCEVGPRGIQGPYVRGGDLGLNFNNITLFDTSAASRSWTWHMDYARNGTQVRGRYGRSGNTRWLLDGTGMRIQKASDPNGPWDTEVSLP